MTSERETAEISIPTVADYMGEATFIAKRFEDTYSVSLDGPVPIVLDQIVVTPAEEDTYCGVELNIPKTSKYHTHMLEHIIISAEQERRLVEWLHKYGANFIIGTIEHESECFKESSCRSKCAECGEYFGHRTEWGVTLHRDDGHDLHFCDRECFQEASE